MEKTSGVNDSVEKKTNAWLCQNDRSVLSKIILLIALYGKSYLPQLSRLSSPRHRTWPNLKQYAGLWRVGVGGTVGQGWIMLSPCQIMKFDKDNGIKSSGQFSSKAPGSVSPGRRNFKWLGPAMRCYPKRCTGFEVTRIVAQGSQQLLKVIRQSFIPANSRLFVACRIQIYASRSLSRIIFLTTISIRRSKIRKNDK